MIDGDDVRVIQSRHRPRLAEEAAAQPRIRRGAREHDLEGDLPLQAFVEGPEDPAHAALPEDLAQQTTAKAVAVRLLAAGRRLSADSGRSMPHEDWIVRRYVGHEAALHLSGADD